MQRIRLTFAALGLLSLSLTGCCCPSLCGGYGAGYAPACAPACPPTYGAGYGMAPAAIAPGGCPTGNCGVYPTGAFYGPGAPVAAALPGTITTAAVPMNTVPTY